MFVSNSNNRINYVNDDYFDVLKGEQYWLLGLFASDGYITKKKYVGLSQSGNNGFELIKYINKILENENKVRVQKTICQPSYKLYFSSKKIGEVFEKFNIVEAKTDIYKLPEIKEKYFNDFIRGYFEGDGSVGIYNNGKGVKYLCASFVGTKEFIKSCNNRIPIKGILRKVNEKTFELRYNGCKAVDFCEWMYSNKDLYKTYKFYIYEKYINEFYSKKIIVKKEKARIKNIIKKQYMKSPTHKKIMELSKKYNIAFQTIYKWKKEERWLKK
jgi:hypothetical protein